MEMTSGGNQGSVVWRVLTLLAAATAAVLWLMALGGSVERAHAACPNAEAAIGEATAKELRKALVCVINNKRDQQERKKVDRSGKLQKAAKRHNETMLAEDCWKHKCPDEKGLGKRIRRTGYLDGARKWRFAENFGCALTPKGMMKRWLEEDFQRRNLLNPEFEDIGAAAAKELVSNPPSNCDGDRVTYTVVLAMRKG